MKAGLRCVFYRRITSTMTLENYNDNATMIMIMQQGRDFRQSRSSGQGTLSGFPDLDSPRVAYHIFNLTFHYKMVEVSKLLKWSRIDSSLTIKCKNNCL